MKSMATFRNGKVVAIDNYNDNYTETSDQRVVTNAAFIGGDYYEGYFYPPQPFPSWTRNDGHWVPPVPYPTNGNLYEWNETLQHWEQADG